MKKRQPANKPTDKPKIKTGIFSLNFNVKISVNVRNYFLLKMLTGFTNNFMIFSSNCAGGMGGFDLYYVGINR